MKLEGDSDDPEINCNLIAEDQRQRILKAAREE